jgi:hypothetical protein
MELTELTGIVQSVEPAALLVPPRLLRRVIKRDRSVSGLGLQVPHRFGYVIAGSDLLKIAGRDELGLSPTQELPGTVILLVRPDPDLLATTPREAILTEYWRSLFHARIHVAVERHFIDAGVTETGIQSRIEQIGAVEFEEIRAVLGQDGYLLPPGDDRTVYTEFAAVYLELRYFAAALLPHYFPGIARYDRIDAVLAQDVNGDQLFAATRPAGAGDPVVREEPSGDETDSWVPPTPAALPAEKPPPGRFGKLIRRAKRAAKVGNLVRAAILRTRAVEVAPLKRKDETLGGARAEVKRLAERLQVALELPPKEADAWRRALMPLVKPASSGVWPVEARLLYDLQKVCIDHERELYAVDLVEWAVSLGRRALKRPLPHQREVLRLRHLRSASRRLRAAHLTDPDRQRLTGLFRQAICHTEEGLRTRFRPVIQDTLQQIGMRPANLPEHVAEHKLIEEILDQIGERGFITMSDLRDAISRNNLKMPDLGGLRELTFGDQLILLNRRLPTVLDGVYRRGEGYFRWLQRASSLAFGTRPGRFLTQYLAIPFGGAFVALEGLQHVLHLVARPFGFHLHTRLANEFSVPLTGVFLLAVLYFAPFRQRVIETLRLLWRGLRALFFDLPVQILNLPVLRRLLRSRAMLIFRQALLKPLIPSALTALCLQLASLDCNTILGVTGVVFVSAVMLVNTRLGADLEETLTDWLVRAWQRISFNLLPGLFRLVMGFFKWLVEFVDRSIYRVDEWLRFRQGEGRLALVAKPVLGLFWFMVTYVVRFCLLVLIEPQVNPIKHFPVVTVSHKLVMTLFFLPFRGFLENSVGMEKALANTVALSVSFVIPGFFGFLVWELKENWRLYRTNRSPTLVPVPIGSHGETMVRFLRPGLHSGTVPKLFAKLRRAERTAQKTGEWRAARKQREALHHVEESIRHFVEREFVFLLNHCPHWGSSRLTLGAIRLCTNRVGMAFECPEIAADGLKVAFEERSRALVAGVADPGWMERLSHTQAAALGSAIAGLYQMAGADALRQQNVAPVQFERPRITWDAWVAAWEGRAANR